MSTAVVITAADALVMPPEPPNNTVGPYWRERPAWKTLKPPEVIYESTFAFTAGVVVAGFAFVAVAVAVGVTPDCLLEVLPSKKLKGEAKYFKIRISQWRLL